MAKADEKGAGSFPHRMGRGRQFHCARFCLERPEVGAGLWTGTYLTDFRVYQDLTIFFDYSMQSVRRKLPV